MTTIPVTTAAGTTAGRSGPARLNGYVLRSSLVAALGGLLFGFDTAVIAGTTRALVEVYALTPAALGITVSSALWGTVIGSLCAAAPSDRYGRRASLAGLGVLYLISALGCALAWNWWALLVFRAIGGLAIGASSVIGPMYIAEISPAATRGRLVGLFQLNVVVGILVAYLSNYFVSLAQLGAEEWRWKLGAVVLPAAGFLAGLAGIPQSPRWLAAVGRRGEARDVLARIGEPEPDRALDAIAADLASERQERGERLFQHRYRRPIFLAITIASFNQLSGINAILYYLNDIFERAGFSAVSSEMQAVAIGLTNLVFTLAAMYAIDRFGRKPLLLTGAIGTAISLAGVAVVFMTGSHAEWLVWLLAAFIASFAFSQGAVIWVYISEIFPTLVRAKGQSLGSFTHWILNAAIAGVFPIVAANSSAMPFFVFALMMLVQFVVVLTLFPETKGVPLEEIDRRLRA
jgi:MFS transporter, SP family, arabinose:H+ symporter